jgi:hypothetical protein
VGTVSLGLALPLVALALERVGGCVIIPDCRQTEYSGYPVREKARLAREKVKYKFASITLSYYLWG